MALGLNRYSFRMYVEAYAGADDPQRKRRDDLRKLSLLARLVKHGGLTAKLFPIRDKPYLYIWSTVRGQVGGAKVYQEGDQLAYKFQSTDGAHRKDKRYDSGIRKAQSQYETARTLPLQEIFIDFQAENSLTEMQVMMRVADEVARRMKEFFKEMVDAKKNQARERDQLGDGRGTGISHVTAGSGGEAGSSQDRPM